MVTIFSNFTFPILKFYIALLKNFWWSVNLLASYKRDTELTIFCYVNKACAMFLFCWYKKPYIPRTCRGLHCVWSVTEAGCGRTPLRLSWCRTGESGTCLSGSVHMAWSGSGSVTGRSPQSFGQNCWCEGTCQKQFNYAMTCTQMNN